MSQNKLFTKLSIFLNISEAFSTTISLTSSIVLEIFSNTEEIPEETFLNSASFL
jgi:hypothetical protein